MSLPRWLVFMAGGGLMNLLPMAVPASAQITTNTALPVTQGQGIFRAQSKVIRATGDGATDEFGRLPQPLQLGSGSWGPFVGLVFTWQTLQWQVDVSPVYRVNTKANDFEFGDEARLDVASKYWLWTNERSGGVPGFFYANLETNLIWQGKNEIAGQNDPNSGGTTWLEAPGLQ